MAARRKTGPARIEAAVRELAGMGLDVPRLLERLVLDQRKVIEGGGKGASPGHGGRHQPLSPRLEAIVRTFRRDLYVLFLESDRPAQEVAGRLPERGIRRLFDAPADADVAFVRARLARQIDEKRALVGRYRRRRGGTSLAWAARHIADEWVDSPAERGAGLFRPARGV